MMYDRHELLVSPAAKILRMLQLAPHNPMGEEGYFTPNKEQPGNGGQQGTDGKIVFNRIYQYETICFSMISLENDDLKSYQKEKTKMQCAVPFLDNAFQLFFGKDEILHQQTRAIGQNHRRLQVRVGRVETDNVMARQRAELAIIELGVRVGINPNGQEFELITIHHAVAVEIVGGELFEPVQVGTAHVPEQVLAGDNTVLQSIERGVNQNALGGREPVFQRFHKRVAGNVNDEFTSNGLNRSAAVQINAEWGHVLVLANVFFANLVAHLERHMEFLSVYVLVLFAQGLVHVRGFDVPFLPTTTTHTHKKRAIIER
jgi:hypothetical protein